MKTIQELKKTSLIELAANAKEWQIKTANTMDNCLKCTIYRRAMSGLPEYIRTCNYVQWYAAKLWVWVREQKRCKVWAMASGIVTGFSLAAIVMMSRAGVDLIGQMWAVILFAIAGFILTISSCKL